MVPRTGPFSASCAFCSTSWYQRGKSSARGVRTGPWPCRAGYSGPPEAGDIRPSDRKYFRPRRWYFNRKAGRFVSYGDRRARAPRPAPRPRDRGRAGQVRGRRRPLPRRGDRRRRVPGVPAQPGDLRPAPGRPQPDAAGEDPLRQGRARPARDARLHRRDLLARAGATSPPARTPSSTSCSSRTPPRRCALLASVGLTSREACGDTVRNVAGCHLAGACPYEVLDISPWAEATKDLFLRNPIAQRMPRKFKINFSGCATDCGQAMFNDVGIIAVNRPLPRRHRRARVPGVHGRRARRQPAPRAGARGVHLPRGPAAHHRGDPARAGPPRQPRQQAAGAA